MADRASTSTDSQKPGGLAGRLISRRTIAKGAVWSVPVIASVTLAPQAAASTTATVSIVPSCGTPGRFVVTVTSGTLDAGSRFTLVIATTGNSFTLTPGNPTIDGGGVFVIASVSASSAVIANPTVAAPTGTTFTVSVAQPDVDGVVRYRLTGPTGVTMDSTAVVRYASPGGCTTIPTA